MLKNDLFSSFIRSDFNDNSPVKSYAHEQIDRLPMTTTEPRTMNPKPVAGRLLLI